MSGLLKRSSRYFYVSYLSGNFRTMNDQHKQAFAFVINPEQKEVVISATELQ